MNPEAMLLENIENEWSSIDDGFRSCLWGMSAVENPDSTRYV